MPARIASILRAAFGTSAANPFRNIVAWKSETMLSIATPSRATAGFGSCETTPRTLDTVDFNHDKVKGHIKNVVVAADVDNDRKSVPTKPVMEHLRHLDKPKPEPKS